MMNQFYSILYTILFLACSNQKAVTTDQVPKILFEWSKTPCFGTCPVFNLSIDELGNLKFNGVSNVAQEGEVNTKIAEIELNHLVELTNRLKFHSLERSYDANITDVPSSTILYRGKGTTCTGTSPMPYDILERELELLAIKYKLLIKNKIIRPTDKNLSVIVEGKTDLSYVSLIENFPELHLSLIQKISLTKPIFLLTFDREYTADQVVALLRDEPEVVLIEKNKTLKRR